jgi:hypothetical protein
VINLEEPGYTPTPVPDVPQTPEQPEQPEQPDPVVETNLGDEQIAIGQPIYTYGEKINVDFSGLITSGNHRITIAPVGSPDAQLKMWLYANGTQKVSETSPGSGTVSFLSQYVGVGQFEARLFVDGSEVASVRKLFEVTE